MSLLRLGTRGSLLARSQSALVAADLESRHPGLRVQTVIFKTTGDRLIDQPLHEAGGKGLFVKELEQALLDGAVDFAVHSCKDLPVTMPLVDQSDLLIAAVPARHDPRDLLISRGSASLDELPQGAKVATGSLRRRCQLLTRRPDLQIQPIRGNIDTRLRRLGGGEFDALILALAGVARAGLMTQADMHPIPIDELLPAPAQGALALQCRRDNAAAMKILASIDDPATHACILAERAMVAALLGDCHSPIGALAHIEGDSLHLRAVVGRRDGGAPTIAGQGQAPIAQFHTAVAIVHRQLQEKNVSGLLHGTDA